MLPNLFSRIPQPSWSVAAKQRNRLQHALNGNTAASAKMRAIRAEMTESAIDEEELDFLNLCAAFACLRVPWCVIKQRRRSHCVAGERLDADFEDLACSFESETVGVACKDEIVFAEQVHRPLHPRYPQRKRSRRPYLFEYLNMDLPEEAPSVLHTVPLLDFPVLAPVPLSPSPGLPLGAMPSQAMCRPRVRHQVTWAPRNDFGIGMPGQARNSGQVIGCRKVRFVRQIMMF